MELIYSLFLPLHPMGVKLSLSLLTFALIHSLITYYLSRLRLTFRIIRYAQHERRRAVLAKIHRTRRGYFVLRDLAPSRFNANESSRSIDITGCGDASYAGRNGFPRVWITTGRRVTRDTASRILSRVIVRSCSTCALHLLSG